MPQRPFDERMVPVYQKKLWITSTASPVNVSTRIASS